MQMSAFHAYERKMYIKQSGNHMDGQYNIDILLLCLNVCTTEQSQMDGLSEKGGEEGRESREVNYNARKLFLYKVLALN